MIQLETKHFGTIEVDENGIVDFPEGIPGFEDVRQFVLLGSIGEDSPFQWIQSVDRPELALVVIDPKSFMPDYVVDIPDGEVEMLEIKDTAKVAVFSVVVVPEDIMMMTVNLKAPILINIENKRGKQVIMDSSSYPVKYSLMQELRKTGGKK